MYSVYTRVPNGSKIKTARLPAWRRDAMLKSRNKNTSLLHLEVIRTPFFALQNAPIQAGPREKLMSVKGEEKKKNKNNGSIIVTNEADG